MTVRSTRFIAKNLTPANSPLIFQVPAGYTLIWKQLAVTNNGGAAASVPIAYGTPAGGMTGVLSTPSINTGATYVQSLYMVLEAADAIAFYSPASGNVLVWCSGSLLTGVPYHPPGFQLLPALPDWPFAGVC